jgi:8-oxo-dGTP pyrophosphatase MutT (NUDIX family)
MAQTKRVEANRVEANQVEANLGGERDATPVGAPRRPPLAHLAGADLERLVRSALEPIAPPDPHAPSASDHDLNPELIAPADGLQPAAVLVPLIERPDGVTVLLTQRADRLRRHAGQIAFPGGRCEAGETPWVAALREAHEEVGLDPALTRLAGLGTAYRTITGFHIIPVVAFVSPTLTLTLNPDEVAEAFEVPFSFLMDPANHERRHRDQPPGPPRWHWAMAWRGDGRERVIWGATAGMVRGLYQRLERAYEPPAA